MVGAGVQAVIVYNENSNGESSKDKSKNKLEQTEHSKDRKKQGESDSNRNVGDPNKVADRGKQYTDSDTGNTVHVDGYKVVITDGDGKQVTQFKNTRKNTLNRIKSGRWIPKAEEN